MIVAFRAIQDKTKITVLFNNMHMPILMSNHKIYLESIELRDQSNFMFLLSIITCNLHSVILTKSI